MSPFEVISWPFLGVGTGFVLAIVSRWRAIPLVDSLIAGAAGGLIGGAVGRALFPQGPLWGDLRFNAAAGVASLIGALVFVVAARLFAPKGQIRPRTP
ncbi:MAG TPA: hypothetical protein VK454_12830 [Myxococcaceae bacterium]|nr:hypothetical protein [Myxococcaceae bacterium]